MITAERRNYVDASHFELDNLDFSREILELYWDADFGRCGWPFPDDVAKYNGWRSDRGAGLEDWYSPSTRTASLGS